MESTSAFNFDSNNSSVLDACRVRMSRADLCFYSYLANADSFDEFEKRTGEVIGGFGYSDYHFAQLEGVPNLERMITKIPPKFFEIYAREELFLDDMYLRQAKSSILPFFQSDLEAHSSLYPDIAGRSKDIKRLSRSFQVNDSYNISVPSSTGSGNATLCIFSKGAEPDELKSHIIGKESLIHLMADAINVLGPLKFPNYFVAPLQSGQSRPTHRWHHVLQLMVENSLNVNQVADRLNLSPRSISDQISIAKKKLEVSTIPRAVAKAIKLGLVDLNRI